MDTVCSLNAKMNLEKWEEPAHLQVPWVSTESELLAAEEILSNDNKDIKEGCRV